MSTGIKNRWKETVKSVCAMVVLLALFPSALAQSQLRRSGKALTTLVEQLKPPHTLTAVPPGNAAYPHVLSPGSELRRDRQTPQGRSPD